MLQIGHHQMIERRRGNGQHKKSSVFVQKYFQGVLPTFMLILYFQIIKRNFEQTLFIDTDRGGRWG